ncbi:hypothetical protein Esi_0450_0011 [Ectocarpus siliculosus]|uniref:Uncharacterized protein n=1 Tax=Ectocarpus siliculosus TaxID=2880 RepID=D7G1L4_ECTSI|nr:hypothetical protein Esi_0450_0011 [Ectocarpus siliculosus]|eukprot:CBJ33259.1 hypothetical protein Esi_0450_0011 [Ectocarpus siliculosus]
MQEVGGDEGCEGADDYENNGGRVASDRKVAERGNIFLSGVVEAENGAHDEEYSSRSNGFFEENGRRGDDARVSGKGVLLLGLVVLATMALCMSWVGGGGKTQRNTAEHGIGDDRDLMELDEINLGTRGEDRGGKRRLPIAPFSSSCPYAILAEEEGHERSDRGGDGGNTSAPGNVVVVTDFNYCRLGNRFLSMGRSLSLGYCCKSRLVSLPPKDDQLAPGRFNDGTPGPRNFDFSSAPDVEGFDSSSCPPEIKWGGTQAFHLEGLRDEGHPYYTPGLFTCIKELPWIIGCEAAYFFPTDMAVPMCPLDETAEGGNKNVRDISEKPKDDAPGIQLDWEESGHGREATEQEEEEEEEEEEEGSAGNLVMHVRSGDIFVSPAHPGYGQYYVQAIQDQQWDRVDVVTNGIEDKNHAINPIVPALEAKVAKGQLPGNIHFHKNRTMEEDLLSMICADGFVAARSTLGRVVSHLSSAKRMYFPTSCNEELKNLGTEGPGTQVFGMASWDHEYTVFRRWNNTADQIAEMMTADVGGFEQCTASRP